MPLVRALVAVVLAAVLVAACSSSTADTGPYGAQTAKMGEALAALGWNMSVSNLRFDGDYVLVDVDAAASTPGGPHAKPDAIRFGLYGALAHPIESNALGGCSAVTSLSLQPAAAPSPDKLSGTVCLGPLRDQTQVRGVYAYSPQDKIAGTTVAYAAAFPVGLMPTNENDTGMVLQTTSVDAFRGDGAKLEPTALGDVAAFTGNGYMLLGLRIDGQSSRIPRGLGATRRSSDGRGGTDAARRRAVVRVLDVRVVAAGASRLVAGRDLGAGVAVHAGRDQLGAALPDGVGGRHACRTVDP